MSNDAFLPEDYTAPTPSSGNGKYTKFTQPETRLRILSKPVLGWEYWNTAGKPVRLRQQPSGKPADMRLVDSKGREERIKHFWAMKVYNETTGQMEVCQITQATIISSLTALARDKDWGNPMKYDVKVLRKITKAKNGEDMINYDVNPVPHQPVSETVKQAFIATPIDLDTLFIPGADPFSNTAPQPAPSAVGTPAPAPAAAPATAPAPVAPPAPQVQGLVAGRPPILEENDLPF